MKKILQLVLLLGPMILALTACSSISSVLGNPGIVSAAQAPQNQSAVVNPGSVDSVSAPVSNLPQQTIELQLVLYAPDRSIRIVDPHITLSTQDKPVFNSLLPSGGSVAGTAYVLDSTNQVKAVSIDSNGTHDLSFIQNPSTYGLAVWPGDSNTRPRLAWGTMPDGLTRSTTLQISNLDGSQRETLLTEDASTLPVQLVAEYWSADGQWLYFSKEPSGIGGYILFSGASNLYRINITTKEIKDVVPSATLTGPQACLDAVSADNRFVADHCLQNTITVRDLLSGGMATILPPQEIKSVIRTLGSARFSPDGNRLAFALARSDPENEQGWVAVSDGLSGESKLVLTAKAGTYYTIAGWLDSQTLLVQSTNLLACTPYCSGELWIVRIDGTYLQKVADGSFLTVITDGTSIPQVPDPSPMPPTFTPTPLPPTFTPTPRPAKPTANPVPCNQAHFVKDVTVKDGSLFAPGEDFTKTWRLENGGTCTWTKNYELVFRSGDQMDGPDAVSLGVKVKPGETVDVSVELTAPEDAGEYTGYWALRDDEGHIFGIGDQAKKAFWVNIVVKAPTRLIYDFTANYCAATWSTSLLPFIPCPSRIQKGNNPPEGITPPEGINLPHASVMVDSSPMMETGYVDNEPALITYPEDGSDGYIRGQFPAVKIEDGDRFKTIIGCLYESWDCNVTMILSYSINGGAPEQLGKWTQTYDNEITHIDIDLSFLAGKKVEFIFTTRAKDSNLDDWAFWLMPRIVR